MIEDITKQHFCIKMVRMAECMRVWTAGAMLDARTAYAIRLFCYGTLGMTREWLLEDNGTPAEEVVRMMFDAMTETLKQVFFKG